MSVVVEVEQHPEIAFRHRPVIGAPRQRREDLPGAPRLVLGVARGGPAHEDAPTAGGLVDRPRTARLERTGDRDAPDVGLIPGVAAGNARVGTQKRLTQGLRVGGGLLVERHLHRVRTGPDRYPDLPRLVGGALPLDVFLVLGAAPVHSFRPRLADDERLQRLAVQAHLELVRCVERLQRATGVAAQPHTERVLGVLRERVVDPGAAAGAERQPVHANILRQIGRQTERLGRRRGHRSADRETADLLGGRKIALEQARGHPQHAGDVVEAVAAIVGRQQRRDVDLEREQVANDVVILAAVEPVEGVGPARVRMRRRSAIELGLQPGRERLVGGGVRPGSGHGRHGTGPHLAHHLLPDFGMRPDVRHVHHVEREVGGPEPLVVAGDAVAVEQRALWCREFGRRRLSWSDGAHRSGRGRHDCHRSRHQPE